MHSKNKKIDQNFDPLFNEFKKRIYGGIKGEWRLRLLQEDLVITSYSIHYTKLYDTGYGIFNMTSMQTMFNSDKAAIIANVGPLIRPINKQEFEANIANPPQLFSHIDQQKQWTPTFFRRSK